MWKSRWICYQSSGKLFFFESWSLSFIFHLNRVPLVGCTDIMKSKCHIQPDQCTSMFPMVEIHSQTHLMRCPTSSMGTCSCIACPHQTTTFLANLSPLVFSMSQLSCLPTRELASWIASPSQTTSFICQREAKWYKGTLWIRFTVL